MGFRRKLKLQPQNFESVGIAVGKPKEAVQTSIPCCPISHDLKVIKVVSSPLFTWVDRIRDGSYRSLAPVLWLRLQAGQKSKCQRSHTQHISRFSMDYKSSD